MHVMAACATRQLHLGSQLLAGCVWQVRRRRDHCVVSDRTNQITLLSNTQESVRKVDVKGSKYKKEVFILCMAKSPSWALSLLFIHQT